MSETDLFYSEESDGMSKRTQLEEYFSQSLEVELLLRLCPDDEDIIYQICFSMTMLRCAMLVLRFRRLRNGVRERLSDL